MMDGLFTTAPGTHYSCAPVHAKLGYTQTQIDDALKANFPFENGFEWRWPEPHEWVYHRPEGGLCGYSFGAPLGHTSLFTPVCQGFMS